MIINLWLSFLGEIFSFSPFIYILACILAVCCILLMRSLKVW